MPPAARMPPTDQRSTRHEKLDAPLAPSSHRQLSSAYLTVGKIRLIRLDGLWRSRLTVREEVLAECITSMDRASERLEYEKSPLTLHYVLVPHLLVSFFPSPMRSSLLLPKVLFVACVALMFGMALGPGAHTARLRERRGVRGRRRPARHWGPPPDGRVF